MKRLKKFRSLAAFRPTRTHVLAASLALVIACGAVATLHAFPALAVLSRQRQINLDGGAGYQDYNDVPVKHLPSEIVPPSTPPSSTTDVSTQYVNNSGTVTGHRSWSTQISGTLWYAWNRGLGGTLYPSSDTAVNGYVAALSSPNVTIGYDYGVYDADNPNLQIPEGSTIPAGKKVLLKFAPYTSDNIFWFGTGYSMDSPYGEWRANAAAPSRVSNQVVCADKDLTAQYTAVGNEYDVYIPFVVNPPSRSVSNTAGFSCGALTTNSDGSQTAVCTATGNGATSPTFNYAGTYGKFYYRYHDNRNMTSIGWGGPGCYGNNIPLTLGANASGPSANSDTTIEPGYTVTVPAQSFAYPLIIAGSDNKSPAKPAMTCTSSVKTGQNVTATLSSTDPDGDQVQYGTDWIDDGTQSVNSGWTSLVNSGTSQTLTKTGGYSTPGTYTIYGWARDKNEAESDPASCTVTVTNADAPDLTAGGVTPASATVGTAVTLTAKVTNGGNASTGAGFTDMFQIASDASGTGAAVIGTWSSGALAQGASNNPTVSYTPSVAGTRYVRACADKSSASDAGVISESDESNNCGAWTTFVIASVPFTCSVSPTSVTENGSVTYTATAGGALNNYEWTASDGVGSYGNGSTATRTFATAGSYGMSVTRMGVGSANCPVVTVGTACSSPKAAITANKTRIVKGDSVMLSYNATGIEGSCSISGPGVSKNVAAASCTVAPANIPTPALTTQSTYTITCGAATDSVTINVIPGFSEF